MFYLLEFAVGTKDTGPEFPQSQEMIEPYNYDALDSISIISSFEGKELPLMPNLNGIKVRSRARLTDVLSVAMLGTSGKLISKRLQFLLQEFTLVNHKFYPAIVEHKGKFYDNMYVYMHLISDLRDYVDYEKSKFRSSISDYAYNEKLRFKNKNDTIEFYETIDRFHTLKSEYVSFLPTIKNYDLFYISNFDKKVYISEFLRDCLIKNNVTGISINLTDRIRKYNL